MTDYKCKCGWEPPEFVIELDQGNIGLGMANLITPELRHIYLSMICPTCQTGRAQPLLDDRMRIRMRRIDAADLPRPRRLPGKAKP